MTDVIPILNRRYSAHTGLRVTYVGRPTALGNPFVVRESRAAAIDQYAVWLAAKVKDLNSLQHAAVFELAYQLITGQAVALECWCAPLPCHASVIRKHVLARAVVMMDDFASDEARPRNEALIREAHAQAQQQ